MIQTANKALTLHMINIADASKKSCPRLGMDHKPHDTRHTFITKAKDVDMNEYILKMIVGHEIADITEKVYTHRTVEDLKREMEKITK